jgi:serine protease
VVCTDTVTYDWATDTLTDNTAGTTATVLANTCSNTGSWSQASASLTAGHSYTLRLTDHDDGWATDPTYTLYDDVAIGAPPSGGGIVNGGFETGTLSGWTASGTTSVVAVPHSGSYSALAGSTSPTYGDSSLKQTFTVPSGASTLGLYYANNCPDTVYYDWVTVTLKDNTAGTTRTLVPRTCATQYIWTHVTASVTAGHSYTLTLTNHDDNWATDPTYSLFDDVVLQ